MTKSSLAFVLVFLLVTHVLFRTLRKSLGTQKQVSEILGCTAEALSQRESGRRSIRDESFLALVWIQRERRLAAQSRIREV